jgi:hypothetical protein
MASTRNVDMISRSLLTRTGSAVGGLGLAFAFSVPACPPATPKAQSWNVYQWSTSSGIEAADLAPSGPRVAILVLGSAVSQDPHTALQSILLQIWDFRTGRMLLEKQLETIPFPYIPVFPSLAYVDGGRELVYCDEAAIHVLETTGYREVAQIALREPPRGTAKRFAVIFSAVSSGGRRFAVLLGEQEPGFTTGEINGVVAIRVYDLVSRKLLREWSFTFKDVIPTGFAISPDGTKVAWTRVDHDWPTYYSHRVPPGRNNLEVLDVGTGNALGIHTDRQEGELAFSSDDRLLSISRSYALRRARHDGIQIWDAQTGKLLGVLSSAPNGVHHRLAVSDDGRIVLGFVGRDKTNENFVDFDQQQFSLWDLQTRKLLFTSPMIHAVTQTVFGPAFRLSPDGRLVLAWWRGYSPVRVYEPLNVAGPSTP